mmetsp:Transcript_32219/g.62253  ORF Transcript_32219/g.62253 Transcript_32219/m.62253 type:complete len:101 (-) Transcript_32219:749-1051(-)|eukprot:CAMPEP_0167829574 /NCGR_PEP_ID=MMETSP0112_2-20121227/12282_1 /TAXON_ID=91324 /ORGANISM="Lotharella globosa, Strain CCCM811" /LENGTH=100 /DNA_ID=CAMNT_0007733377 /DNA_START=593 /DNA_END=895 /DNA_ORIENTATION=+
MGLGGPLGTGDAAGDDTWVSFLIAGSDRSYNALDSWVEGGKVKDVPVGRKPDTEIDVPVGLRMPYPEIEFSTNRLDSSCLHRSATPNPDERLLLSKLDGW